MPSLSEQLLALAPDLGATVVSGTAAANLRMTHGAHVVRLTASDGKHPRLHIEVERGTRPRVDRLERLDVPEPPLVELVAEDWLHRLGKALRLNREVQSGDPTFDAAVYIHANNTPDAYIRHLLRQPGVADAARSLIQNGYHAILIDAHTRHGVVSTSHAALPAAANPAKTLQRHIEWMTRLAAAIPAYTPQRAQPSPARGSYIPIVAFIWTVLSIILAVVIAGRWPVLISTLNTLGLLSASVLGVMFVLLIGWLRGSSRAMHCLCITMVMAMLAVPLTLLTTLHTANALLDRSSPRIVPAEVVDLRATKHKNNMIYHATLDLRDGWGPQRYKIPAATHARLSSCAPMCDVTLRDGALGWPWMQLP